jgi:hypothetical protein
MESSVLPAKALLSSAWQVYKKHWKLLVKIYLIPVLILFAALFAAFLTPSILNLSSVVLGVLLLVVALITVYVSIWAHAALIKAVDLIHKNPAEQVNFKMVFSQGRNKIGAIFGASLLAALVTIGGFILLIVPGIIWGVWYSLTSFVVVCEDESAMNAFRASKRYVKGRTASVLGRWVVVGLVYAAISIVIRIVIGTFIHGSETAQVVNAVMSLFVTPFVAVYGYLLYVNLKNFPLVSEKPLTN